MFLDFGPKVTSFRTVLKFTGFYLYSGLPKDKIRLQGIERTDFFFLFFF